MAETRLLFFSDGMEGFLISCLSSLDTASPIQRKSVVRNGMFGFRCAGSSELLEMSRHVTDPYETTRKMYCRFPKMFIWPSLSTQSQDTQRLDDLTVSSYQMKLTSSPLGMRVQPSFVLHSYPSGFDPDFLSCPILRLSIEISHFYTDPH